jgi:DNA (cytosine-5)-methyltransferase 1
MIGKRDIDDSRNALVFHFIRLVLELNPKFFVMENVRGLTLGNHKKFLLEIISEFKSNGYEVEEKYQLLNAANYGVPQNRERLFILGCRQGLHLPKYPQPITKPPNLKSRKLNILPGTNLTHITNTPTVWDAIKDLPEIEKYPELNERDWVLGEYGKPSHYAAILRSLSNSTNNYSYERQYDPRILTSSRSTNHNLESIERFAATLPGKTEPISRFYKLDPQGICNTLRAGTASNRGAFTSPRPIHPFLPRCITVREAARLHSYPDWFRFHITKWHGFRQIGNSVPPLLAKAVASEIIRALGVSPVKPKDHKQLGEEKLLELNVSQAAKCYGVDSKTIEFRIRREKTVIASEDQLNLSAEKA